MVMLLADCHTLSLTEWTGDNFKFNVRHREVGRIKRSELAVVVDADGPDHNKFLVKLLVSSGDTGWINRGNLMLAW